MHSYDARDSYPASFVVVAVLTLGVMAMALTFTCSWMAHRKRRVGSHMTSKHGSLVMEVPPSRTSRSNTMSGQPRYTSSSLMLGGPHAPSIHPAIIITPPTPLALLANPALLDSDSSIGSAADLMADTGDLNNSPENPKDILVDSDFCGDSMEGEANTKEKRMLKELRIRELKSKKSVFNDVVDFDHRTLNKNAQILSHSANQNANTSVVNYNHLQDVKTTTTTITVTSSSISGHRDVTSDKVSVIIDNDFISTKDVSERCGISPRSPRPRLSSMEPGTARPHIFRTAVENPS